MSKAFSFEEQPFEAYSEFDPKNFEPELSDSEWEEEIRRGAPFSPRGTTGYRQPGRPPRPWPPRRRVWGYSPPPLFVDHRIDGEPPSCICPAPGTEFVGWVQSSLNQVQGLRLPVTGVMNAATRSALRRFQHQQGLTADGIAGPETERALVEAKKPGREKTGSLTNSAEYEELDFSEFETPQEHAQKMLQVFLDKVRNSSKDFRQFLLIAKIHPRPTMSEFIRNFDVDKAKSLTLGGLLTKSGLPQAQVDRDLYEISAKFWKTDAGFRQQAFEETKHWQEILVFTAKLLASTDGRPILVDAALLPFAVNDASRLGLEFARKALPQKLYQWISHSEASEAHGFNLFKYLKDRAGGFEQNPAFKAEVERARKESDQVSGELMKRSGTRESKCVLLFVDNFSPGKPDLSVPIKKRMEIIAKAIVTRLKLEQLKGKRGYVRPILEFKGFVDPATDPKKFGDLDIARAARVESGLKLILKAMNRILPIGISIDVGSDRSGGGPQPRPARPGSPKPTQAENRRVEVCLVEVDVAPIH